MIYNTPTIYKQGMSLNDIKNGINWESKTSLVNFDTNYFTSDNYVRVLYCDFLKLFCFKFTALMTNLVNDNNWIKVATYNFSLYFTDTELFLLEPTTNNPPHKAIVKYTNDGIYIKLASSPSCWYENSAPVIIPGELS